MSEPASTATILPAARPQRRHFASLLNLTLLGLLALMWIGLGLGTDSFATVGNVQNLLRQGSIWAIMAVGQTFVIITAGIDLSAGAVVGVAGTLVALLIKADVPVPLAILATLGFGGAVGWCHGFGIVRMGLPPFIMTLASLTALRGIGLLATNGQTIAGLPASFSTFARGSVAAVPDLFLAVIAIAVPCYLLLHHSRWGRYLYAVGSNREAARLSGVKVGRVLYLAYILSAVLSALAGILTTARIGIGVATTGDGWELQAIASSVIGGASLFGAVGSIPGPLLGAMLLTTINNGANLLNINPFWQRIITGGLIVAIVYLDQLRRPKR